MPRRPLAKSSGEGTRGNRGGQRTHRTRWVRGMVIDQSLLDATDRKPVGNIAAYPINVHVVA